MKKYLCGLVGSLVLFGGILNAQAGSFLDPIGFTIVGGEALGQNDDGQYGLITDGNSENIYQIDFSSETSPASDVKESMTIGLCLQNADVTLATLEPYYTDREMPDDYRDYLLSAAAGNSPFAVVRIEPAGSKEELPFVKLCDGAVYSLQGNCEPMRIPGDYPNGMYSVSSCNAGDPPLAFQLVILADVDGDGVTDDLDACPDSDLAGTVIIDGCDSGVANALFEDGCTISDTIMACAEGAENHGEFVSCVTQFTNGLKPGLLSGAQKGAIQSCAAQSSIGGLPCESNCDEDASGLGQNRHRARYGLVDNDLVIPCVDLGAGQYIAVDMNLSSATSKNFHFKMKKAEMMTQAEMNEIVDPESTCAHYDLLSNNLLFPSLEIGEKQWRVQMKLLGANSVNLHFKLEGITEIQ
jgi:hypothetical protein